MFQNSHFSPDAHISDDELLLALDGELPVQNAQRVSRHLASCWTCRTRQKSLEETIADFVHTYQQDSVGSFPPPDGPRARLKARLSVLATSQNERPHWLNPLARTRAVAGILATAMVVAMGIVAVKRIAPQESRSQIAIVIPNTNLTPGATVLVSSRQVCASETSKNGRVPDSLRRRVFEEYGIRDANPRAYEVDYLITPALGGADDIRNLWPESYSATVWNAQVKDRLEDRLRELVCEGKLDLTTAQRDIATDWIGAYRKYFRAETPLQTNSE